MIAIITNIPAERKTSVTPSPLCLHRGARDTVPATLAYAALTILLTWPLARGVARDLPGDFGDPVLNTWILAWDAEHLIPALTGHPGALRGYWNANIYYPHPLSLAYSEHLTAQALQILPVYAVTRNPVLCYNLLFLSTFVLSGLGMFLFAGALTGRRDVAFVAGLAYAFAPYRFGAIPHLQVLSSAWMPFVLLGFRRFFETGRTAPLLGATAAWIAQNLSCGYYLLFFTPIAVLYIAWELSTRRQWDDRRTMARLCAAGIAVVVATLPFVLPYLELRRLGFSARSLTETDRFAADVYGYLTTHPSLRLWGGIVRAWPKAEGDLFPGMTIVILAAIAIVHSIRDVVSQVGSRADSTRLAWTLGLLLAAAASVLTAMLFGWTLHVSAGPFALKITSFDRAAIVACGLGAAWLACSARARIIVLRWVASTTGALGLLTVLAVAMSFGPHIHARGRLVEDANVYALFYDFVPGFDGLRVPARFAMIVAFGLAALGACGAAVLARRAGRGAVFVAGALILVESIAVPLALNANATGYKHSGLAPLPASLAFAGETPDVYKFAATLPRQSALVELPFGEPAFDVRYMFYSTRHWLPLVNGYSGGSPIAYGVLGEFLADALIRPDRAWTALVESRATYAIVHEAFYTGTRGRDMSNWLGAHGAREIASFGSDRVFQLLGSQ